MKQFAPVILKSFPQLEQQIRIARIKQTPEKFVQQSIFNAVMATLTFTFLAFVMFSVMKISQLYLILVFPGLFVATSFFFLNIPVVYINRRRKEIEKNVLFAGRYLLVKIQSGGINFLIVHYPLVT